MFALLSAKGQLVVRLPHERVEALIAAGDGAHFVAGHGKMMRGRFAAGAGLKECWLTLAEEALAFVEGA
jgi:hypothetical protein